MGELIRRYLPAAKKFAPILLIVAAGLLLILGSGGGAKAAPAAEDPFAEELARCEKRLSAILKHTAGVGRCEVMLTLAAGSRAVYAAEWELDANGERQSLAVQKSGQNSGPVQEQTAAPEYRGAVIACAGGDRAEVRLAVTEAVRAVTGLSSDRITVLKLQTS